MLPSKPDKRSKTFSAFNCVDKNENDERKRHRIITLVVIVSFRQTTGKSSSLAEIYENFNKWTFESFSFYQTKKAKRKSREKMEQRVKLENNIYKQASVWTYLDARNDTFP